MASIADQDRKLGQRALVSDEPTTALTPDPRTTPAERALLFATVILLPLELQIPTVAGFSSLFLMFVVLAGYVAVNRLWCFNRIWMHPVFVAAYVFIGISAVVEFANPLSSYEAIGRFPLMISGALLVASLCRDRAALKVLLYGYIGAALWLGALLFMTSYGTLSGIRATDFGEASKARAEVFEEGPIRGNLNTLAIHCVQGGIVAMAFALGGARVRRRNFFALIGIFCVVASSLPMSRGAIINAVLSCGAVLKVYGIRHGRAWLLFGVLAMAMFLMVPDAIWSRMTLKSENAEGRQESRFSYYENAIKYYDDFLIMGVGAGNYFNKWGFEHGYGKRKDSGYIVYVVHNAFLQVLVYWGVFGLVAFLAVIWQAYRCLPRIYSNDALALGMLGIVVSLLLTMPFASEFHNKGFSLGFGMLVAYQRWLTPSNAAQLANR